MTSRLQVITLPGAELGFMERCPLPVDKDELLKHLIERTPWKQEEVSLWGKTYPQPRLTAWYGDAECRYVYSGVENKPQPWTEMLWSVKEKVEQAAGCKFNSVLLNYYRNERDSIGFHSDDEAELGRWPAIASLSLGAPRIFAFKHRTAKDIPKRTFILMSGSLLVMSGPTQENWKHGIEKTKTPCGPRVNLTFRQIRPLEHQ